MGETLEGVVKDIKKDLDSAKQKNVKGLINRFGRLFKDYFLRHKIIKNLSKVSKNYYTQDDFFDIFKTSFQKKEKISFLTDIKDLMEGIDSDINKLVLKEVRPKKYFKNKNLFDVIMQYNYAIPARPQDYTLYRKRGNAWHELGYFDKAIADYSRALKINNQNNLDIVRERGIALLSKRDFDNAVNDFSFAITQVQKREGPAGKVLKWLFKGTIGKTSALDYAYRAQAHLGRGEYNKVIDDCTMALVKSTKLAEAYLLLRDALPNQINILQGMAKEIKEEGADS